ncbi:MAG: hypothetical protein IJX93_09790 [Clostridia bacterium]|nr:hypothetical protein [Clostridia bacterium]
MTELDKLKRAKMYIDKLADGINPLDDTCVGENDVVNQVRVVRCLNYVSDVLAQVIGNGGSVMKKTERQKNPFGITRDQLEQFPFSETPLTITEISLRINGLIDRANIKKFRYTAITDWLMAYDLIETITDENGKNTRCPTDAGREIGIFQEQRYGSQGTYTTILYSREAQQFILDNFESILEFREEKKAARREKA